MGQFHSISPSGSACIPNRSLSRNESSSRDFQRRTFKNMMDFNPDASKWKCCCCSLPSGLTILATAEIILSTVIAAVTTYHIANDSKGLSLFEICLLLMMLFVAGSSVLLILGIQKHRPNYMYPSIAVRGLLIIFIQAFGVSTVVSPHERALGSTQIKYSPWKSRKMTTTTEAPPDGASPNMALRLVGLVFAMLFLTVLIFYCIYLVVRGTRYEAAFARLKQRRDSLIQAGMIDPDFGSRRPSDTPQ